jgi:integrase
MSRPAKGARLYLRAGRAGRAATYVILDGAREIGTGCGQSDRAGAEKALAAHLATKYTPPRKQADAGLADILIADVMQAYLREHAAHQTSRDWLGYMAEPIIDWWGDKTLAAVRGATCREYVAWRTAQLITRAARPKRDGTMPVPRYVTPAAARHELKTLRSAINFWHAEYGPLPAVPVVTLPDPPEARDRWLTRSEAARMLWIARRGRQSRHLCRLILIGLYTGTRSDALVRLSWLPSPQGGWVDLDGGVIHRRGSGQARTKKRQPPLRIPDQLLHHLRRWHRLDAAASPVRQRDGTRVASVRVVHYYGRPIAKLRRAFATVAREAGLGADVTPHTLRHTAATWLMQGGGHLSDIAGFLGMSLQMLQDVYGHHHPDFQTEVANTRRGRRVGTKPAPAQETPKQPPSNIVKLRRAT